MGNISKRNLALAIVIFLCSSVVCVAQPSGAQEISETSIQIPQTNSAPVSESDLLIGNTSVSPLTNQDTRGNSTIFLLLRMIVVLAIVIACIYFVLRIMRRATRVANNNDQFLRVVANISLSPGKTVHVVTLLDHAYIVGATDNAVNLIGEVSDKELVDAMNLYADKQDNTGRPRNFNDVLSIFMPNSSRERSQNVFDNSANSAEQFFKRQRDRLHNGE